MNQPGICNLEGYRGDALNATITIKSKTTNEPIALPDGEWRAQIRERADNPVVIAEFSVDATNRANGIVTLSLDPEDSARISSGVWDLEHIGIHKTYLAGTITLTQDVTR